MLEFRESLKKLENSEEYKFYKKKNTESYLINVIFLEFPELNYFSPKTKIITVFRIKDKIIAQELDKEEREFPKLEIDKIKVDFNEAIKIFEKEKSYSQDSKIITILQQNSEPTWNLSQLTPEIKILHVLISAVSGELLESTYKQIIEKA